MNVTLICIEGHLLLLLHLPSNSSDLPDMILQLPSCGAHCLVSSAGNTRLVTAAAAATVDADGAAVEAAGA